MFSPKKFNGNVRIEGTKSHTQVNIVHKNRNWHKPFARCAIHYSFYNWQCVLWPCCLWLQFSDISSSGRSFIMHWNSFEKTVIICKQIGYSRIALTEAKFNPSHYLCVRFFCHFYIIEIVSNVRILYCGPFCYMPSRHGFNSRLNSIRIA